MISLHNHQLNDHGTTSGNLSRCMGFVGTAHGNHWDTCNINNENLMKTDYI